MWELQAARQNPRGRLPGLAVCVGVTVLLALLGVAQGAAASRGAGLTAISALAGRGSVCLSGTLAGSCRSGSRRVRRRSARSRLAAQWGTTCTAESEEKQIEPCLETLPATVNGETSATLHGVINPHGLQTTVYFEWATEPLEPVPPPGVQRTTEVAVSGSSNINQQATITGLQPGTTYYFAASSGPVVEEPEGSPCVPICASSEEQSFTTPGQGPPSAATTGAGTPGAHTATLEGEVNPRGPATADYYFAYGTSPAYGAYAPAGPPGVPAGSGSNPIAVAAGIAGLKVGTTYHYQLFADNLRGTVQGGDRTFTTTIPPPLAITESPTSVGDVHGTLQASVNPEESETTYQFEYWPSARPGEVSKIPATPQSVGSGTALVKVSQSLTRLTPRTEYAYRVLATNRAGTAAGAPVTFATGPSWVVASTPVPSGATESELGSVSCVSVSLCVAVGSFNEGSSLMRPLGEMWNGVAWQMMPAPPLPTGATVSEFDGVACVSATECLVVADYSTTRRELGTPVIPFAERWNGTAWTLETVPLPSGVNGASLVGIDCPSAKLCEAVGDTEPTAVSKTSNLAEQWNGTAWSVQTTPNPATEYVSLREVSCASPKACTAVGSAAFVSEVEHWNGVGWKVEETPAVSGIGGLGGVSCAVATACEAVGSSGNPFAKPPVESAFAQGWSGSAWTLQPIFDPAGATKTELRSVSCWAAAACTATGSYRNSSGAWLPLGEDRIAGEWKLHAAPSPEGAQTTELYGSSFNSVSCAAASTCTAVGEYTNSSGTRQPFAESYGP